jgi:hypothetical protein
MVGQLLLRRGGMTTNGGQEVRDKMTGSGFVAHRTLMRVIDSGRVCAYLR